MFDLPANEPARRCARTLVTYAFLLGVLATGCKAEEPGDDSQSGAGGAAGALPTAGTVAGMAGTAGVAGTAGTAGMAGMPASGAGAAGAGGVVPGQPTFSAIFSEILTRGSTGNCMFGACHGGEPDPVLNGNLQIKFDDKQGAYDHMVNVVSTSTLCAGMTLVIPGNAAGSMLIQKLGPTPPCGMRMPIGLPLTDAQMMQISTWINNGAAFD